ncbi:MAG: transglycosylase SLT domain-containing protein [Motiliproteus sp.]
MQSSWPFNPPLNQGVHRSKSFSSRYRYMLNLLLGTILLGLSVPTLAIIDNRSPEQSKQLQQQRAQYQQARGALQQKNFKTASPLIKQLKQYPLYSYLIYQRHLLQLEQLNSKKMAQFDDNFADSPLPYRLHRSWLSHLAKQKQWDLFLKEFRPEIANTTLQCQQLWGLLQTGHPEQAFSQVAPLWLHGSSRPKACDELFNAWINRGDFSEQHAWDRFWLALDRNNAKLANYLTRYLEQPQRQKIAKQALWLHKNPKQLAKVKLNPNTQGYDQLVVHSINRLGRRDPTLALAQLERFSPSLNLPEQELQKLQRRFSLRLLKRYQPPHDAMIQQLNPKQDDAELTEWQLRNSILQQDWQIVDQQLAQLPLATRSKDRWRYWQARALTSQTKPAAHDRAAQIYAELAQNRSFYGFMAADKLGSEYQLNNQPHSISQTELEQSSQHPGVIRARELFHHQQRTEARREWRKASQDFDSQQHHLAGQWAKQWGWHGQAIRSAISARQWNDLLLRFPLAYNPETADSAELNNIEQSWILAITRQESAFTPDARSHAGATGLMQLMPATAKETARKAKIRYRGSQQLIDPELNLKLGSSYLARLSRRYEGNRVLASAAYNAGPHRVNGWLKLRSDLPADIWIETIPFDETRNYVQNVLSFAVIYSDLLGLPKQLFKPNEQLATLP